MKSETFPRISSCCFWRGNAQLSPARLTKMNIFAASCGATPSNSATIVALLLGVAPQDAAKMFIFVSLAGDNWALPRQKQQLDIRGKVSDFIRGQQLPGSMLLSQRDPGFIRIECPPHRLE